MNISALLISTQGNTEVLCGYLFCNLKAERYKGVICRKEKLG
jgi:hypothetical protein